MWVPPEIPARSRAVAPLDTGWIVRGFFNLTDNPDSMMILREDREDREDPSTESRFALPAGAQLIVYTQRLWHAVCHQGQEPRYCLITSWESGPELGSYIQKYNGIDTVESYPVGKDVIDAAQVTVYRRHAERAAALAARKQADVEVVSEA